MLMNQDNLNIFSKALYYFICYRYVPPAERAEVSVTVQISWSSKLSLVYGMQKDFLSGITQILIDYGIHPLQTLSLRELCLRNDSSNC